MIRDRSTISIKTSPRLLPVSPARIEWVFVHIRPLDTVEGEPKLVQSFLHRCADRRLLRFAYGISFHRERPYFHVLFVDAHMQRPVADIFGFVLESIMLGQAVDDPRHALISRAFKTKSLAGVKLQPTSLVHQELAPVEKRFSLG